MAFGRFYLSRLAKDLEDAVAHGIVTPAQAEKIKARVAERSSVNRVRGAVLIATLAGLFVVAGVSLVIAHNWERIPALAKVLGYLGLLAAVGECAIRFGPRVRAIGIALEVVWFFLPLVGIGLFAQIFQLSGDPVRPFLLWLVLALPIAWLGLSPPAMTAVLHVAAAVVVVFWANFGPSNPLQLGQPRPAISEYLVGWIASLAIWATALATARFRLRRGRHTYVAGAFLLWVVVLTGQAYGLEMHHTGWLVLASFSCAVLWHGIARVWAVSRMQRALPQLALLGVLYAMTFLWHRDDSNRWSGTTQAGVIFIALLFVAAVACAMFLRPPRRSSSVRWHRVEQALLAAGLAVAALALSDHVAVVKGAGILANVTFAAVAVSLMWHGTTGGHVRQINLGVAAATLLLVTRFFDVFGSMLQQGTGFIVVGLVLGALAYGLHRGRRELVERAGELARPQP